MTGLKKAPSDRTPNEQEVIDKVTKYLPLINDKRRLSSEKRAAKGGKQLKPFKMPTADNPRVGYEFLVALFAMDDNHDYRAIYCHVAQNAVSECIEAWKSFYAQRKAGFKDAKIPRYKKKGRAVAVFNNQGCRVESGGMLKISGIRKQFDVGSFPHCSAKLIEVRIVPYYGYYRIHIVTDDLIEVPKAGDPCRLRKVMMIDLGVDNFATITDSIGRTPILYSS